MRPKVTSGGLPTGLLSPFLQRSVHITIPGVGGRVLRLGGQHGQQEEGVVVL